MSNKEQTGHLSDQELRCVRLACDYPWANEGGNWHIDSYVDDLHTNIPTA